MENNIALTGDEARIIMSALLTSDASLPASSVLKLWFRLVAINQVQPPVVQPPLNKEVKNV